MFGSEPSRGKKPGAKPTLEILFFSIDIIKMLKNEEKKEFSGCLGQLRIKRSRGKKSD